MAKRKIVWSSEAKIDLFEILDFYYQRNGNKKYSVRLNHKIKNTVHKLKTNPRLGLCSSEKNIRIVIEGDYLIFYQILPSEIKILKLSDSRQNPNFLKYRK